METVHGAIAVMPVFCDLSKKIGDVHVVNSWMDIQTQNLPKKIDNESLCFARKVFSQSNDGALEEMRTIRKTSHLHPVVLIERSRDARILRQMLWKVDEAAMAGKKEAVALLKGIVGVVEVVEPPRWRHLSNIALTFGQLVVTIPVSLYRSGRLKHVTPAGDWEVSGWTGSISYWQSLLKADVERLLPHSVAESVTTPTASTYVFACLAFGIMVAWQYHYNRRNKLQGPLLAMGVGLGVALSALTSGQSAISANAIMPATIVLGLIMGQLMEVIRGIMQPNWADTQDERLRQTLEEWMTGTSDDKRAIRFLTLNLHTDGGLNRLV